MKFAWLPEGADRRYCLFLIKDEVKIKIIDPKYNGESMETSEERLNRVKKFVNELIKKEPYYVWKPQTILQAIKNCCELGIDSLPKED